MSPFVSMLNFLLHWVLPFAVAAGSFVLVANYGEDKYRRSNLDVFWKKVLKIAILVGTLALIISIVIHSKPYMFFVSWLGNINNYIKTLPIIGLLGYWNTVAHVWFGQMWAYWSIIYSRAFSFVYVFGTIIEIYALKWRIGFWRAFNVIWPVVIMYPFLISKYAFGYQTPIQDQVLKGILKAKLRENLNDSYEWIDRGVDDKGQPIKAGAGGSVQLQTKSAVNQAMKRTKVTVQTTTDGKREAHVLIRQSRETETDRSIEQVLKGWGERVSGDSIYFPADATYTNDEHGFTFTSSVNYNADEELGSYLAIFENPFSQENRKSRGGDGTLKVFMRVLRESWKYFIHFTPYAIYSSSVNRARTKYFRDTSADKARYKVQQNLDLSVVPTPKDPKSGRTIDEQRELALRKAKSRVQDVAAALSGFGLYGQFKNVKVGGNSAIYEFTLPPDAKLPSDFDKVQTQMGNILRISEKPIVTLRAGVLSVALNNDVNIPVSFADMIRRRSKGTSEIISGLLGEDALGHPITMELGDSMPHVMLFGATGRGKSVLIESFLYTVMSGTDPEHLRIIYLDGKGNSFEFMRADGPHPNPFTFTQPADASGDIEYARALLIWVEKEIRRRIQLFKEQSVAKLSEYNQRMEKMGKEILPEILVVTDEYSAITDKDNQLRGNDYVMKNAVDRIEYAAKMARSVGIRLLLANQTARKEKVPGKISANITGRVSMGVSEPVESEIALPETGIKANLISQPGEFYSLVHGAQHPEHGNGPYLLPETMNKLNDGLTKKFGKCKYVKTRKEIFSEAGIDDESEGIAENTKVTDDNQNMQLRELKYSEVKTPKTSYTSETRLGTILHALSRDPELAPYVKFNETSILDNNLELSSGDPAKKKSAQIRIKRIKSLLERILSQMNVTLIDDRRGKGKHSGDILVKMTRGSNRSL